MLHFSTLLQDAIEKKMDNAEEEKDEGAEAHMVRGSGSSAQTWVRVRVKQGPCLHTSMSCSVLGHCLNAIKIIQVVLACQFKK